MRLLLAVAVLATGCAGVAPDRRFLAELYPAGSAPPAWDAPGAPATPIETTGDMRRQLLTAPDGKLYQLRWRKVSQSVGSASRGSLDDGRRLPAAGPGFRHVGRNPFGTDETVVYLQFAAWAVELLFPKSAPVVIGDISRDGGGHLSPHRSHQSGRDADVGYYARDNKALRHFAVLRDRLDAEKTWTFVEALLRTRQVQYIFMDRRIQEDLYDHARKSGWSPRVLDGLFQYPAGSKRSVIRHLHGHADHMHVRFRCPPEDADCTG